MPNLRNVVLIMKEESVALPSDIAPVSEPLDPGDPDAAFEIIQRQLNAWGVAAARDVIHPETDTDPSPQWGHAAQQLAKREEQQRQGIFLCYRREDSRWQAGRLADALASRFGDRAVFMDVNHLRIGNWRKQIDQSLADCAAVIVVIGPQWLAALEQRSASGDQVRYEIAQALLLNKIIIPVAVDRARLPDRGDLPDDIAALNDAQGYELGVDVMWRPTVGKLLDDLSDLLRDRSTTQ
jgi:TIR domain